jgi:hypothetical protein
VSETWSFSFVDPRARFYVHGRDGRAAIAGQAGAAAIELTGEGPFTVRGGAVGELELEPLGGQVAFDGLSQHDWICRGRGRSASGAKLDGYGVLTRVGATAAPVALRRRVWLCIDGKLALSARAQRAGASDSHGAESLEVYLARGTPVEPARVADPRLSTTYDAGGHVIRAGLELWEDEIEDERERGGALRFAGETVATAELDDVACAFMVWHRGEDDGVGCYTLERSPDGAGGGAGPSG